MSGTVPFREAVWTWARVAALSFGGPAGQIAVMHRILVEEKRWIGETRFLHALNYCMLLPGPEAHELAIYIGWLMHRVRGGLVAGVLFVLPGLVTLGILSWVYAAYGQIGIVQGLFFGLRAAVLAVVLEAVVRVGKRALKSPALVAIAAAAFVAIFFLAVPFPLIVLGAALIGWAGNRVKPQWFASLPQRRATNDDSTAVIDAAFAREIPAHVRPSWPRAVFVAVIGGAIWLAPLVATYFALGQGNVFTAIAAFNSKMALVTFGGAYAVLAYMAQQAVDYYHWLKPDEMLVGLGFAETTPGPLISVVQFVGFMAAFRNPGALDHALAGTLGGVLAMWATFVPPFIWIFLGGPYMEALLGNKALHAALSGVTAAVVGIILNLAVWFGLHLLFQNGAIDWPALVLTAAAMVAMFRFKIGMIPTLAACSAAGALYYLATGAA